LGGIYYSSGTLFSIDPKTHVETVLHSFGNSGDGQNPNAAIIELNGIFYGTTTQGGTYGFGAVFFFNPKTGTETVLHSFNDYAEDSIYPDSALVAAKGILYGTTYQGGVHESGDIYSVDPKSGTEQVVYSFPGSKIDGYSAGGSLLSVKGLLYGATGSGGDYREWTIFSFGPTTGAETVVYSFCPQRGCADGENPSGDLIEKDGMLFGTSSGGRMAAAQCLRSTSPPALRRYCTHFARSKTARMAMVRLRA
jgi:uncharacterized repeat protein (TIGR03803 family)